MQPRLVIIESPWAYGTSWPLGAPTPHEYALIALRDSLERSEAPIASHLLHTQVLADHGPSRERGITAGLAWMEVCELVAFYCDFGMSSGMTAAWMQAEARGVPIERRTLGTERIRRVLASIKHAVHGTPYTLPAPY